MDSSCSTSNNTSVSIPVPPYSLDLIDKLLEEWKINEESLEIQTVNKLILDNVYKYIESSEEDMEPDDWIKIIKTEINEKNIYLNLLFKLTKRLKEENINIL